jgi:hypothetical protein
MADTDHYAFIDYSKDGGRNWCNRKQRSIGKVGQYEQRIKLMRMGTGRTWIFRISVSSARKRDLLGAVVSVEPTEG